MIIFMEAQRLAEEGLIDYTGKTFKAKDANGDEIEYKETEPIHTYAMWKQLGFQVIKGQKAVAKFPVWKHTTKQEEVETEQGKETIDKSRMFMKTSAFFSMKQVEKIKEN